MKKNDLSSDFQLGYNTGDYIIKNYLPTLSTDMIKSNRIINVSEEDILENKRLDNEWYKTTKHGGNWDGINENGDIEKWNLLYQHNKMLEKKYLPNPLICDVGILNIQNINEFKRGLNISLWDCDICSYSIKPENIKIYNNKNSNSTIIELKL